MIKNKRTLTYVVIALILGLALALVVVLSRDNTTPTTEGSKITPSPAASENNVAVDPAKKEPLLDKFKSKDPFIPLGLASSGDGDTSDQTGLSAKITVNGTSYTVVKGDQVPSGAAVFTISSVTSSSVTFSLISGVFENGDAAVTVNVGDSVEVTQEGGPSYTLKVVSIGDSGNDTNGHTITALSITESNGTAFVSLEIDDETYSDKKVGDTFSTSWGEVKILSINVGAQTVTIMHGDQTITLRVGQVLVK